MRLWFSLLVVILMVAPLFGQCVNGQCSVSPYGLFQAQSPCASGNCSSGTCRTGNCQTGNCQVDSNPWKGSSPSAHWRYVSQEGPFASVVRVRGKDSPMENSLGSGCAVRWGSRVVILTAEHVIRDAKEITVRGLSGWHSARLLHHDRTWDVAVLAVESPSDFKPVELYLKSVRVGDTVTSAGFGGLDDRLAANTGKIRQFGMPSNRSNGPTDWLEMTGYARQGDSGGPVFNGDKLTGVLWGAKGGIVTATQSGLLYRMLVRVLGPPRAAESMVIKQTGLLGGGCLLGGRQQPQSKPPQTRQVYTPPQVNVQADPRVGNALVGINAKLDQVVVNTTPQPPAEEKGEEVADKPKVNPGIAIAIALMAIGGVVFMKFRSGGI